MFALANAQERKSFVVAPAPLTQEEGEKVQLFGKREAKGECNVVEERPSNEWMTFGCSFSVWALSVTSTDYLFFRFESWIDHE